MDDFGDPASCVAVLLPEEHDPTTEDEGDPDNVERLGNDKNARILIDFPCFAAYRSYSSIKLFKSSSHVIKTSASRSSVGN